MSTLLDGCYSQWPDLIDGSERSRCPHSGEIAFPYYGVEASSGGDTLLIPDGGEEATNKLGHIATILMTLLFVIRASTMGGMLSNNDIWLDASGHLCMIIRFVKCWVTGQQKSTGKRLPIRRVGRDSIPPGENGEHPRSRAFAIIMEAKNGRQFADCQALIRTDLIRPQRRCRR